MGMKVGPPAACTKLNTGSCIITTIPMPDGQEPMSVAGCDDMGLCNGKMISPGTGQPLNNPVIGEGKCAIQPSGQKIYCTTHIPEGGALPSGVECIPVVPVTLAPTHIPTQSPSRAPTAVPTSFPTEAAGDTNVASATHSISLKNSSTRGNAASSTMLLLSCVGAMLYAGVAARA